MEIETRIRPILGESCDIHTEGYQELSEKLKHVGLCVLGAKLIRFRTEFRLERYVKSRVEMQRLKKVNPNLWKRLKMCTESGKLEREFILLTSKKRQNHAQESSYSCNKSPQRYVLFHLAHYCKILWKVTHSFSDLNTYSARAGTRYAKVYTSF